MAKEQTDRTTLDLFAHERRPGRPKTNLALMNSATHQQAYDAVRARGLKRVELKLNAQAVDALNDGPKRATLAAASLLEEILRKKL
ncbi:LexA regulated protein [Salmonella enterica subsp. enterica]|nr:LexA regulated protein [Salmonella enterica subsp. enterica]